jgi:hypothetical protein
MMHHPGISCRGNAKLWQPRHDGRGALSLQIEVAAALFRHHFTQG